MAKDEGALRAHFSAMRSGRKGSLIDHVGTDVGPKPGKSGKNTYRQINPNAVRGKKR